MLKVLEKVLPLFWVHQSMFLRPKEKKQYGLGDKDYGVKRNCVK